MDEAHWFAGFGEPGCVVDVWTVDVSGFRLKWYDNAYLICR